MPTASRSRFLITPIIDTMPRRRRRPLYITAIVGHFCMPLKRNVTVIRTRSSGLLKGHLDTSVSTAPFLVLTTILPCR